MDAAQIDWIETNVERIASATFAAAVGYAVYGLLVPVLALPQLGACAAGTAALAYVICIGVLGAVTPRKPRFAVSIFDVRDIDASELLLTDSDRLDIGYFLTTQPPIASVRYHVDGGCP